MPRDVPKLSGQEREEIARTLAEWADAHPHPDIPLIALVEGTDLSPREIAAAVQDPESRTGRMLYRVFATALIEDEVEKPESLQEILSDFRHDTESFQYETESSHSR
jgi:hypothetical protein